jgi:hypothetical protein
MTLTELGKKLSRNVCTKFKNICSSVFGPMHADTSDDVCMYNFMMQITACMDVSLSDCYNACISIPA